MVVPNPAEPSSAIGRVPEILREELKYTIRNILGSEASPILTVGDIFVIYGGEHIEVNSGGLPVVAVGYEYKKLLPQG